MTDSKLRVGVIGMGQMGTVHANVLHRLAAVELVAVADVDERRRRSAAATFSARPYADYHEMLRTEHLDAVDLCMPDAMHREPVVAAAESHVDIFMEKPLATSVADARAILEACDKTGARLMVAHLLRFDPRYEAVARAAQAGELGEITHVMAHRNSPWTEGPARYAPGTSLTFHVAIHDLDLVNWLIGSRPVTAYALNVRRRLAERDMDDAVSAVLRFESGAVANLQYSWALPPTSVTTLDARLEVIGTEGMAIVGGYHGQGVFIAGSGQSAPDVHHGPQLYGSPAGDVREELMAFVDTILHGTPVPYDAGDAFLAVREAAAIEEAIARAEPVSVD